MASTYTSNYNFELVEIGASRDTWGAKTNANWVLNDTKLDAVQDQVTANNTSTTAAFQAWMPIGIIVLWGLPAAVPAGFAICDGRTAVRTDTGASITTPNLVGKFVRADLSLGLTGGANSVTVTSASGGAQAADVTDPHTLTIAEMPAHFHTGGVAGLAGITQGPFNQGITGTGNTGSTGGGTGHTHPLSAVPAHTHSVTVSVLPSYFSMIYIMRI